MVPKSFDSATAQFKPFIHSKSHTISKLKPKIRIIHIIEPEIIKTDVENFRGLVQRLTGKPDAEINQCSYRKIDTSPHVLAPVWCGEKPPKRSESERIPTLTVKMENEDAYGGENIPDLFLSFLEESDGFIFHGIDEFPLLF